MAEPSLQSSPESQRTGRSDQTRSSFRSTASVYNLNATDTTPILLLIPGELRPVMKTHERELHHMLEHDELSGSYPYRLVRKPIPKFALKMRVHRSDLWFDDEREQFKDTVAIYDPGVADIYLRRRWTIWMSRLFGYYKELYILAPSCGRPSNHYWNPGSDKTVSTSSASTTSLYNLNKEDTTPIVLFDTGSSGDLRTMSQRDLCKLLEDEPWYREDGYRKYRVTRKPIPRFAMGMEVLSPDVWFDDEKEEFVNDWNRDHSIATIRFPANIWTSRLFGSYKELYILSPARGRPGSDLNSANSSYRFSRWGTPESEEAGSDAKKHEESGAEQDVD